MSESCQFNCYLTGSTSRLIACGRLLLEKGHHIHGVISNESDIMNWTKENGIHLIMPNDNLLEILRKKPFDLFFSIDNFWKIPNEILGLPKKYAINFHDGPLPKYAGVNATNWAIINEETCHGITWHIMTDNIDAGDILKQTTFPLSEKETALSLNTKCYEKSIQCFNDLLCDLEKSKEIRIPQNLNLRTYYPRWKRPPAACTIDWNQSAEQIYALYRALEFGNYPNPLGLPKLLINDQPIIVTRIDPLLSKSSQVPGTITSVTDEMICVSTKTKEISLSQFKSSYGKLINPSVLLKESGLCVGDILTKLEDQQAEIITKLNLKLCKHENFWIRRFQNLKPLEIPYAKSHTPLKDSVQYKRMEFSIAESVLSSIDKSIKKSELILSASILYLARLGNKTCFDINYQDSSLQKQLSGAEHFYSTFIPLHVEINEKHNFREFHDSIKSMIESIHSRGSFPIDIFLRSPVLRKIMDKNQFRELPLTIIYGKDKNDYHTSKKSELIMVIPENHNRCVWIYDSDVITESDIQRIRDQFIALLTEITQSKNKNIMKMSILSEYDKKLLFSDWDQEAIKYNFSGCIHHKFESQAELTPNAIAIDFEGQQLTYRELNERSNQLGHYLQSVEVGSEVRVCIAMERSIELIIGIYGVLKAGGIYVPIDPGNPIDRIDYYIQDSNISLILTQLKYKDKLKQYRGKIITLDTEWQELIANQPNDNLINKMTLDNTAYVIYTSGSTGRPKGVMNTHRGILNRLLWMQDTYHLTDSDAILHKTPISFDVSVWELFWPLMFGARMVIARPEGHKENEYLVETIINKKITIIHFVPSMLRLFLETKDVEKCRTLRQVICSGEALTVDLQNQFFNRLNTELDNLYGPTEAAIDVTYWRCQRSSDLKNVPIGRPIANTQIYILDENMNPVPIGVPGELHIGGIQVARGYINKPELTKEKFIPDPFADSPDSRLYKTGDLARYLPDGNIEFIGRIDNQIKIRGFRVELGEIETVLSSHDDIVQAVVVLHEYNSEDKRIIAYIVVKDHISVSHSQIRDYLKKKLPDYMIPHYIIKLDTLPTTPSGKLDRQSLPLPQEKQQRDGSYIPPQSEVEKTIAKIWQELLHTEVVGIHDSFFDLGGHSLLLIKMLNKLQNHFGKEVKTNDFFRYPTIEMLAKYLTREKTTMRSFTTTQKLIEKQRIMLKKRKNYSIAREADDNSK